MFKINEYDIRNFYVGELYISTGVNSPLILLENKISKENKIKYDIQNKLMLNGAININNSFHIYDKTGIKFYTGYLTIFYKQNDNYICLHNGDMYKKEGRDFCENLYRLDTILPKLSGDYPKIISTNKAKKIFKQLFDKNYEFKTEKLYTNDLYNLNNFYVGSLAFCYRTKSLDLKERRDKNIDTPQRYILYKSDASLSYITGCSDDNVEFDYLHFNTLFFKHNDSLYNLHNFQIYNYGILEKRHFYEHAKLYKSYYDWMVPFGEVLEEKKVRYDSDTITIPKALKLYRKIK